MTQSSLSRRLSAQDAAFLYFESEEAPLQIGSIAVFEGEFPYERFRDHIASKLHLIPRYLQRIVPVPFNLGYPTWEWDPNFDINQHIMPVRIDSPGTDLQLMDLAANIFAGPLDRGKPLWEMRVVHGLEGGRTALVSKVHHCLVDGVSGIELLMIVLDVSPNPPPPPPATPYDPPAIPGSTSRIIDAIFDNLSMEVDRAAAFQRSVVDAVATGESQARSVLKAVELALPYVASPMAKAPFNQTFGGGRKFAGSEFSFQEVRGIRAACGGTVNDVCLTVLCGALGRYLEMHGQSVEGRTMRILTPVNVRREDERGKLGNRISMLLVELPVGVRDPVERLKAVTRKTEMLKRDNIAEGIEVLGDLLTGGPPPLLSFASQLPLPPNTLGHMVCTNVPGPMIPLYSVGHRMLAHYPLIPIAWEMGIGCGITSYDQKLYFGLIADEQAAPDVQRLKEFLDQAFVELRSAAGVVKSDLPQVGVAATVTNGARRRRVPAAAPGERMAADASSA